MVNYKLINIIIDMPSITKVIINVIVNYYSILKSIFMKKSSLLISKF